MLCTNGAEHTSHCLWVPMTAAHGVLRGPTYTGFCFSRPGHWRSGGHPSLHENSFVGTTREGEGVKGKTSSRRSSPLPRWHVSFEAGWLLSTSWYDGSA